jgi:nicotinate-nucleotide adenylyltransferase
MAIFSPPHLLDGARWHGMRVGILAGSFNPPHQGHLHLSRIGLRMLELDAIWWMVTPQNPLKDPAATPPFEERFARCAQMAAHDPRIIVTDIEREIGTTLSRETMEHIRTHFPLTDFVWLTGMDIAFTLHRWYRWQELLQLVAMAHVARPPAWGLATASPLRMMAGQRQVHLEHAARAPLVPCTTYWILQNQMLSVSSTELRNREQNPELPVS